MLRKPVLSRPSGTSRQEPRYRQGSPSTRPGPPIASRRRSAAASGTHCATQRRSTALAPPSDTLQLGGAGGQLELRREALEHPGRVEKPPLVRLAGDEDEVAA